MTPSFLIGVSVFLFLVWIGVLVHHLRRSDLSDTDRIVWTIVLCTLNLLGVVLYLAIAPQSDYRVESEAELKERFNRGGQSPSKTSHALFRRPG